MDPFEEFEMRPITEGLGFHKKALKTKKEVRKPDLAQEVLGSQTPGTPPQALLENMASPRISEPLPREGWPSKRNELNLEFIDRDANPEILKMMGGDPEITIDSIFPKEEVQRKRSSRGQEKSSVTPEDFLPQLGVRRGSADSPGGKKLMESPIAIPALVVDGLLVVALSMIFLVCLLLVTKSNLDFIASQLDSQFALQASLYLLVGFIGVSYFSLSRSVIGQTLGEWAFEYQVGDDTEQVSRRYPLQILGRSLIILATGIITLPLLSLILRRDLTSYLIGVKLYQRQD